MSPPFRSRGRRQRDQRQGRAAHSVVNGVPPTVRDGCQTLPHDRTRLHDPRRLGAAGHSNGLKQRQHQGLAWPRALPVRGHRRRETELPPTGTATWSSSSTSPPVRPAGTCATSPISRDSHPVATTRGLPAIVVHPYGSGECDALKRVLDSDPMTRAFIMVWASTDPIRAWADAHRALDLHSYSRRPAPDPVMVSRRRDDGEP